jgi:hypothetical protein
VQRLKRQKHVTIEIVMHDDSSLPPSMPLGFVDTHVWHAPDKGYHRTRALRETSWLAKHDYIVFLDDDCFPASDYWALALLEQLDAGYDLVRGPFKVLKLNDDYSVAALPDLVKHPTIGRIPGWFSTTNVGFRRQRFRDIDIDMSFDGHYGNEDVDLGRAAGNLSPPMNRTNVGHLAFVWHVGKLYRARKDNALTKNYNFDLKYTQLLLKGKWKCKKTCTVKVRSASAQGDVISFVLLSRAHTQPRRRSRSIIHSFCNVSSFISG